MSLGGFAIGLSGLNGATRSLERSAFEVARASTQQAGQAVPRVVGGAPPPEPPAAAGAPVPPATPVDGDVDLPRAMVDMISASQLFMANLQTIRRTDEALEALLKDR
jgi:hypothetical protein